MRLSVSRAVVLWALCLGLASVGCSKKEEAKPPAQPEPSAAAKAEVTAPAEASPAQRAADAAWEKIEKFSAKGLSAAKRRGLLERFVKEHASATQVPLAKELIEELKHAQPLERPMRHASFEVGQVLSKVQREVFARSLDGRGPLEVSQSLFFELAKRLRYKADVGGDVSVTLTRADGEQVEQKYAVFLGLGGSRVELYRAIADYYPQLVEGCKGFTPECVVKAFNGVSKDLFKVSVYKSPGVMDKKGVEAVLKALQITPETPLLGTTAAQVYTVYKPLLESLARAHKGLDKAKALSAYKQAFNKFERKAAKTDYNEQMLSFYREYTEQSGVISAGGLSEHPYQAYILVGFWMRRAADGTEPALSQAIKATIQSFDPELYAKLYEAPKK